jgi:hypothetical protein
MLRALMGGAVVGLSLIASPFGAANPASVVGGNNSCTGKTSHPWCPGSLCLYYTSKWVSSAAGSRVNTAGGTVKVCQGRTLCYSTSVAPPQTGCKTN